MTTYNKIQLIENNTLEVFMPSLNLSSDNLKVMLQIERKLLKDKRAETTTVDRITVLRRKALLQMFADGILN